MWQIFIFTSSLRERASYNYVKSAFHFTILFYIFVKIEKKWKTPKGETPTTTKSAPAAARTRDPKLRRLVLYPTELPEQNCGAMIAVSSALGKPKIC